jgi:hypothetical protein
LSADSDDNSRITLGAIAAVNLLGSSDHDSDILSLAFALLRTTGENIKALHLSLFHGASSAIIYLTEICRSCDRTGRVPAGPDPFHSDREPRVAAFL